MPYRNHYRVIGLMSGTSMDGLDLACCSFTYRSNKWLFEIEYAVTIKYTPGWLDKLSEASNLSNEGLLKLHAEYGALLGRECQKFIRKHAIKDVDFIASHGHTIFHQPANGFTFQLGDGNALHAASSLPVVYDFRSLDVMLGGEGAPLVPVGDHFLFSDYDVCLNIGGIANLSYVSQDKRIAYDFCFANMGLNYLAAKAGKTMDAGGMMASDGQLDAGMKKQLNKVYTRLRKKRPSMGRELFEKQLKPLLDDERITLSNRLYTFTESVAAEFVHALPPAGKKPITVLCTGGGAFNTWLLYRMMEHAGNGVDLILPDESIIKFKEALVFAFLGVRRVRQEVNCLASVTGASRDCSSGVLVGFV